MADGEYMARSVVNLPFIDERFEPGDIIPDEAFERYVEEATKQIDDRSDKDKGASPLPTVESIKKELSKWGSITANHEDGIHPDHVIPDPSRPSLASIVAQSEALVAELEAAGQEVPAKLRALAEISDRQISASENVVPPRERARGGAKK